MDVPPLPQQTLESPYFEEKSPFKAEPFKTGDDNFDFALKQINQDQLPKMRNQSKNNKNLQKHKQAGQAERLKDEQGQVATNNQNH